tara:strand:+ start:238 stop:498 length:261 start_codon:yes stop_codon:yes gene_type:complete
VRRVIKFIIFSICFSVFFFTTEIAAAKDDPKSRFYDFSEQIIDGERKKPTTLYVDSRQKIKFDRLLKLKKSFLPKLFATAKERVFK